MSNQSSSALIRSVLAIGRAKGFDQGELAAAGHVAPETVSRAKRRGHATLDTFVRLATAAGAHIEVRDAGTEAVAPARSALADPRWGLAWSNPDIGHDALIANALLKGSYAVILAAALEHGFDAVLQIWEKLQREEPRSGTRLTARQKASVERMLANIGKGFELAQA